VKGTKMLRVRIIENCIGNYWGITLCMKNKPTLTHWGYEHKKSAVRKAKRIAEITGIKYDPEIIKHHGC